MGGSISYPLKLVRSLQLIQNMVVWLLTETGQDDHTTPTWKRASLAPTILQAQFKICSSKPRWLRDCTFDCFLPEESSWILIPTLYARWVPPQISIGYLGNNCGKISLSHGCMLYMESPSYTWAVSVGTKAYKLSGRLRSFYPLRFFLLTPGYSFYCLAAFYTVPDCC